MWIRGLLLYSVVISAALGVFVTKELRKVPCDVTVNTSTQTTIFNCSRRGLTSMPNGIFPNVTILSLAENRIHNLSIDNFKHFVNLTDLDLNWISRSHLKLADGIFHNLTKLYKLSLSGAGLYEVPKLPSSLKTVLLDQNKITSLKQDSFYEIENVTELILSRNCYYSNICHRTFKIEKTSFSHLTYLKKLDLSYNNMTKVPEILPSSLTFLDLSTNRIESIGKPDFSNLTNLRTLRIQGNCPRCHNAPYPCVPCKRGSINIHSQAFHKLTQLQELQLAGNSLKTINSSWFDNMSNLTDLFLSFNFLVNAIADGTFLMKLPNLQRIDLSYNYELLAYPKELNLSIHFSKLVSLRILHIEGYVFQEISKDSLAPLENLKNLSVLNLGVNFIQQSHHDAFKRLPRLRLLYLSENRLHPVTGQDVPNAAPRVPGPGSISSEQIYELKHQLIKPDCYKTGRVLDLSRNNLFFIFPKQFEGFGDILCLNLSRNSFSSAPNGTQFTSLQNLTYLDMSFNKVDLPYDFAFSELKRLEVLDLSYNNHYFLVAGVTHKLDFLEKLPLLRVLNLSSNNIFTLTTKMLHSASLNELQFKFNDLGHMWKKDDQSYYCLFKNLTNLTYIDLSQNGIKKIPDDAFLSLPKSIRRLHIGYNSLTDFQWKNLNHLSNLEALDLSHNHLSTAFSNFSAYSTTLIELDLSFNRIYTLSDGFITGAKSLQVLNLSKNKLTLISGETFPAGQDSYLKTLYLQGNPFSCTCDLLEFILWIESSDVEIPRLATSVTCNLPQERKNKAVIAFDIRECVDDGQAFLFYSLSTLLILLTLCIATALHMFYWDASYVLNYIKARVRGYQSLQSSGSIYDAFVAYDTKDPQVSDWVMNELRLQLEERGDKLSPICLEERDWTPGMPVLDNLTQSIYQSRKTVFVLTQSYVRSGNFRMAVYLAHQRLLDDNMDVIVLLLLEPVLENSLFLRLRRRLCSRSILEWPRNPLAEAWFWQCLRNAISVDNQLMYNKAYAKYFSNKHSVRVNQNTDI